MKKKSILFILCALIYTIQMYGQKKVTTFLGIPVDGTQAAMMVKLKAKGFKQIDSENLTGTFNGEDVQIGMLTYKGKVCRIGVIFTTIRDKEQIKIRYNTLIKQFENNGRYMVANAEFLGEDEDIAHQMTEENRTYLSSFYQLPVDENIEYRSVWFRIFKNESGYIIALFYDNKLNEAQGEDL